MKALEKDTAHLQPMAADLLAAATETIRDLHAVSGLAAMTDRELTVNGGNIALSKLILAIVQAADADAFIEAVGYAVGTCFAVLSPEQRLARMRQLGAAIGEGVFVVHEDEAEIAAAKAEAAGHA